MLTDGIVVTFLAHFLFYIIFIEYSLIEIRFAKYLSRRIKTKLDHVGKLRSRSVFLTKTYEYGVDDDDDKKKTTKTNESENELGRELRAVFFLF